MALLEGELPATKSVFDSRVLRIDSDAEATRIAKAIQEQITCRLKRRGVVLGVSGGIDSSVCLALSVKALGPERVVALLMPEADSDPDSLRLGRLCAQAYDVQVIAEDISPILKGCGCYSRRNFFIRQVFPEFGDDWKCKIALGSSGAYKTFTLVVESPTGQRMTRQLPLEPYLGIVASTNMKQRTRKQIEYYHADRLNYAVVGTPNRLEYDQGFFVKNGDGAADLKPIAHLYKSQVYALAAALDVPEEILRRRPTTDTYSLPQTQEEFYFSLPFEKMDLCLWGLNHGVATSEVAGALGISAADVQRVYGDIQAKRRATAYQHARPLLVEAVAEVHRLE